MRGQDEAGNGCREKPARCLPAADFGAEGRHVCRPSAPLWLGRFLGNLDDWLCRFLRFHLGGELLPYLGGDGLGVHFVCRGRVLENGCSIPARSCHQNAYLYQQTREGAFVSTTEEGGQSLADTTIVSLLPNAMLPCNRLDAVLVHEGQQPLRDEKQVKLEQTHRHGRRDG